MILPLHMTALCFPQLSRFSLTHVLSFWIPLVSLKFIQKYILIVQWFHVCDYGIMLLIFFYISYDPELFMWDSCMKMFTVLIHLLSMFPNLLFCECATISQFKCRFFSLIYFSFWVCQIILLYIFCVGLEVCPIHISKAVIT